MATRAGPSRPWMHIGQKHVETKELIGVSLKDLSVEVADGLDRDIANSGLPRNLEFDCSNNCHGRS